MRKLLKGLRSESKLPDLFIAEPRNQFAGLFIEIKASVDTLYTNDGRIRNIEHIKEQLEMIKRLQNKGFKAVFGAGFDDCKEIIDEYLTPKTELSTEKIEIITCNNFGIDRNLIHSKSRRRELVMIHFPIIDRTRGFYPVELVIIDEFAQDLGLNHFKELNLFCIVLKSRT